MDASIAAILAAVLGAMLTIINQNRQAKKQAEADRIERIAASKRAVISDLLAYRFVLRQDGNHALPTTKFNAALSRIPVDFSENQRCVQLYSDIGSDFTAAKLHELVVELMKDVPMPHDKLSAVVVERLPMRNPRSGT